MDYLLTFEDGSSGYLAHHGVKGMKWGVWNSETKARYYHLERGDSLSKNGRSLNRAVNAYVKANDKNERAKRKQPENGSVVQKALAAHREKRVDKTVSKLAEKYIEDRSKDPISPKDAEAVYEGEGWYHRRNIIGDTHDFGALSAMTDYRNLTTSYENNRQLAYAVAKGKAAVEEYIRTGHTSSTPRSYREQAARDWVVVANEREGKRYKQLSDNASQTRKEFEAINDKAFKREEAGRGRAENYPGWAEARKRFKDANRKYEDFRINHTPQVMLKSGGVKRNHKTQLT